MAIYVHGNYYYMVEGSPHVHVSHVQLTCGINMHGNYYYIMWRGTLMCGLRVAINMHSNYYYMVEGSSHM